MFWAIDKGTEQLIHISKVERGKDCNAKCAGCGADLVANHGKKKAWHFRHVSLANCSGGVETVIHKMAKTIFTDFSFFPLPPKSITYEDMKEPFIKPGSKIIITSVDIEKAEKNFIPDITIYSTKGRKLFIEIAVTHFIDSIKLGKIRDSDTSCIEINLSKLKETDFDYQLLKDEILNTHNAKWIFNRVECEKLSKLKERYQLHEQSLKQLHESQDLILLENIKKSIASGNYILEIENRLTRKDFYHVEGAIHIYDRAGKTETYSIEFIFHPTNSGYECSSCYISGGEFNCKHSQDIPLHLITNIIDRYFSELEQRVV